MCNATRSIVGALRALCMIAKSVRDGHRRRRVEKGNKNDMICAKMERNRIAEQIGVRLAAERSVREYEIHRQESIEDGREFLKDFVRYHFKDYIDHISIISTLTFEEIKMIGNEQDQGWGVRQCRQLFNAPVLNDEVGHLLWCELRKGRHDFRILLKAKYGSDVQFDSFSWID
ncbi:hypothetical protein GGS26DRAFT_590767 [Hypomontagnella submonticulosa]|nr:hypothetical protein GGS26DRAFT_590767 [Hypomontagnella submonticulosa]